MKYIKSLDVIDELFDDKSDEVIKDNQEPDYLLSSLEDRADFFNNILSLEHENEGALSDIEIDNSHGIFDHSLSMLEQPILIESEEVMNDPNNNHVQPEEDGKLHPKL